MSDRSSASALASALKGRGWGSSSQRLELHRLRQAEAEAKEAARGRRLTAALALLVLLPGCAVTYVARAAYEEARILWRRQPIERVLAGDVDAATREKLELTLAVRAFAHATLGLSIGGSYTSLARVEHDQVVHIVSAAPRDRLVPYTWWFPIRRSRPVSWLLRSAGGCGRSDLSGRTTGTIRTCGRPSRSAPSGGSTIRCCQTCCGMIRSGSPRLSFMNCSTVR